MGFVGVGGLTLSDAFLKIGMRSSIALIKGFQYKSRIPENKIVQKRSPWGAFIFLISTYPTQISWIFPGLPGYSSVYLEK